MVDLSAALVFAFDRKTTNVGGWTAIQHLGGQKSRSWITSGSATQKIQQKIPDSIML
jgi:hypothetical protein